MLLQRRSLRSRLDLLRSVSARELCVSLAQHSQQQHAGGVLRDLAPGEPVWARSFRQPDKWLKGTVANNQGTNRYVVNSGDGRLIPRHIDQIRRRSRMSDVPCPSGTNSDQFEGQVSIGSEDALADSNIPDVGSNDDVAEAISVTKSNSEISVPKPVEDPSEPTCTPAKITEIQRKNMLDFMCRHPELANQQTGRSNIKKRKALVNKLATVLNAHRSGSKMSGEQWLECWKDWRAKAKVKNMKIYKYHTGNKKGRPPVYLTTTELALIHLFESKCNVLTTELFAMELQKLLVINVDEETPTPSTSCHRDSGVYSPAITINSSNPSPSPLEAIPSTSGKQVLADTSQAEVEDLYTSPIPSTSCTQVLASTRQPEVEDLYTSPIPSTSGTQTANRGRRAETGDIQSAIPSTSGTQIHASTSREHQADLDQQFLEAFPPDEPPVFSRRRRKLIAKQKARA
ncbi:hypothetical protein ACJJTC_007501, partial [Scirpophaga incertulas]